MKQQEAILLVAAGVLGFIFTVTAEWTEYEGSRQGKRAKRVEEFLKGSEVGLVLFLMQELKLPLREY